MKAKSVKQVLIAVEWILVHVGWTQRAFYRDENGTALLIHGEYTQENLPKIKSVCLAGGLDLVYASTRHLQKAEKIISSVAGVNFVLFNDKPGRTKKQVLAVVRKAIRKAT